jgi:hypothetical protein
MQWLATPDRNGNRSVIRRDAQTNFVRQTGAAKKLPVSGTRFWPATAGSRPYRDVGNAEVGACRHRPAHPL